MVERYHSHRSAGEADDVHASDDDDDSRAIHRPLRHN